MKSMQLFSQDNRMQVVCRVRPSRSGRSNNGNYVEAIDNSVICEQNRIFSFDYVANEHESQEGLFNVIGVPFVNACIDGYNGTILAYGQTGTGKTHTIFGPTEDSTPVSSLVENTDRGLVPRVLQYLWKHIDEVKQLGTDNIIYTCKCIFYEIYQEKIFDLLAVKNDSSKRKQMLQIHEDKVQGVYIQGINAEVVCSIEESFRIYLYGCQNRRVSETAMNLESSRSHAVYELSLTANVKKTSITRSIRTSKFTLVDLAGSERQRDSETTGARLKETAYINKSLAALGLVIKNLNSAATSERQFKAHVPYRDSKLTFLLRDSLGGNSKTLLLATVAPERENGAETLSTLTFAQRAKAIKTSAVVNERVNATVGTLRKEIEFLQEKLKTIAIAPPTIIVPNTECESPRSNTGHAHSISTPMTIRRCASKGMLEIAYNHSNSPSTVFRGLFRQSSFHSNPSSKFTFEQQHLQQLDETDEDEMTFDVSLNNNGRIGFEEFKQMLPTLGYIVTPIQAKRLFDLIDTDASGDLEIENFKSAFFQEEEEEPKQLFKRDEESGNSSRESLSAVDSEEDLTAITGITGVFNGFDEHLSIDLKEDLVLVRNACRQQLSTLEDLLADDNTSKAGSLSTVGSGNRMDTANNAVFLGNSIEIRDRLFEAWKRECSRCRALSSCWDKIVKTIERQPDDMRRDAWIHARMYQIVRLALGDIMDVDQPYPSTNGIRLELLILQREAMQAVESEIEELLDLSQKRMNAVKSQILKFEANEADLHHQLHLVREKAESQAMLDTERILSLEATVADLQKQLKSEKAKNVCNVSVAVDALLVESDGVKETPNYSTEVIINESIVLNIDSDSNKKKTRLQLPPLEVDSPKSWEAREMIHTTDASINVDKTVAIENSSNIQTILSTGSSSRQIIYKNDEFFFT